MFKQIWREQTGLKKSMILKKIIFAGERTWRDTVAAIGVVWTRETLWIIQRAI